MLIAYYYFFFMSSHLERAKTLATVILLSVVSLFLIGIGIAALVEAAQNQPAPCNVADVTVYGPLIYYPNEGLTGEEDPSTVDQTAAENVRQEIEEADADPSVKAILVQIDSPGGDPVAGEDISTALKHASKPTVALVADEGTSAAYWAASGAQTIFASANSELVDIGVTESYLDQTKEDEDNGLTFVSLTAGEYKDMGNPDTTLTPAEHALIIRDLDITDQNFIADVAANRNLSVASVTAVANGSAMLGAMALQNGLIDKIGDIYDAESFISQKIGTSAALCED